MLRFLNSRSIPPVVGLHALARAKGYAFMAKHVVPLMKEKRSGSIINIGSVSSFIAQPAFVPYNTTKAPYAE
jgi:NAD(P)-dependent dehydrogenase (short-subunit alcohol dehydrogenase family)